jgi:uncharacterized RDD family membrane protein YckC
MIVSSCVAKQSFPSFAMERARFMSTNSSGGMGLSAHSRPHAYDPATNPELFDGVLARRVIAFVIDAIIICVPIILGTLFVLIFGLLTFGLGWFLLFLWWPAAVIWTLFYYGITLGGADSATIGMRVMDLQLRTWYGAPSYFVLGVAHAILYWLTVSLLTPFILLVGLFNDRRRLLHDMLIGTVIINHPSHVRSPHEAGP